MLALGLERFELEGKRVSVPGFTPSHLDELGTTVEELRRFLEKRK